LLILCGYQHGSSKDGMPERCWYRTFEQAMPIIGQAQVVERETFSFQMWGDYAPSVVPIEGIERKTIGTLPDWFNKPATSSSRTLVRVAPSALGMTTLEPPAISPLAPDGRKRFLRGQLIHELLQRLPDLPKEQWESAGAARLVRETDLSDESRDAILAETLLVLRDPQFASLFGPQSRAEAAIAGTGPGLPENMVVNGSVDRLVVTKTDVLVLDFKTNRPPPLNVEDVAQIYLNQMAAYRALLQATWPEKKIRCTLLWTDGPRLMELPDAILDQALHVIAALPR
jgi:ATP-dependent helicase/nuclease subunit A